MPEDDETDSGGNDADDPQNSSDATDDDHAATSDDAPDSDDSPNSDATSDSSDSSDSGTGAESDDSPASSGNGSDSDAANDDQALAAASQDADSAGTGNVADSSPSCDAPSGSNTPTGNVTLTPTPVVVCAGCTGGNAKDQATATGTPAGGTFSWSTDDSSVATVNGSGASATVTGVAAGTTNLKVTYTVNGASATASVKVIAVHVDLQLVNTGKVTPAPENSTHDKDVAAAGNVDDLGPLPMGQGRHESAGASYTSPLEVIGTVTPTDAKTLTYRWKRLITRRSWNFKHKPAVQVFGATMLPAMWIVTQRTRRGFPDDDTGSGSFNNAVPNANGRMYIYDCSALLLSSDTTPQVGDYIYEEKDFTYRVERNLRGTWVTCAEFHVGQVETVKRKDTSGTVTNDWQGLENSTAVRTVSATIDEAKVRAIVGGSDQIMIAGNANN